MGVFLWIQTHIGLLASLITSTTVIVVSIWKIGKFIVNSLNNSLNKALDEKLKGLYDNDRSQYRYQIVDFSGDLHNKIPKTRYEFQAIREIHDKYENLVNSLGVKNHYLDGEWEFIEEQYELLKEKERRLNINERIS